MRQIPILVVGYSNYWLSAPTLYCLGRARQFDIHFVTRAPKNPFRFSTRIKSNGSFPKTEPDEAFVAYIKQLVQKTKAQVLLPTDAHATRFVIEHKEALGQFVAVIPLPDLWAYNIASDKGLMADFMQTNGIPTPLTLVDLSGDLAAKLADFPFPVLVKPRRGIGGKGSQGALDITRFPDKARLLEFASAHHIGDEYVIQHCVDGHLLDCNVLYKDGRLLSYSVHRGLVSMGVYAPPLGIEFIRNEDAIHVVDQMMSKLRWSGAANVDLIYDSQDKQIKVLEINPRFWLTVGGALVGARINFPAQACLVALNQPVEHSGYKLGKYISLPAFLRYKAGRAQGDKVTFRWDDIDVRTYFSTLVSRACYFYHQRFG